MLSQFRTQTLGLVVVNNLHTQPPGNLQVQGPVIYKDAFFWRALRNFQGDTEDGFFGLSRAHVAGAEKNVEVPAQIEDVDAVPVKLQRLVVYRADKIFFDCVTSSRMARVSGNSFDCANIKAVNSSRVKGRGR